MPVNIIKQFSPPQSKRAKRLTQHKSLVVWGDKGGLDGRRREAVKKKTQSYSRVVDPTHINHMGQQEQNWYYYYYYVIISHLLPNA